MQQIDIPVLACGKARYGLIPLSLPGVVLLPLLVQTLTIGWVVYGFDERSPTQGVILATDEPSGRTIVLALGIVISLSLGLISAWHLTYGVRHLHQFVQALANHQSSTTIILSPIQELTTLALMLHGLACQLRLVQKDEASGSECGKSFDQEGERTQFCEAEQKRSQCLPNYWHQPLDYLDNLVDRHAQAWLAVNQQLAHEIAERKRAEAEICFQANLLNVIEHAVIATDLEGRITYWNHFAECLYGWQSDEVLGQDIVDITPTEASHEQALEIMAALARGEHWSGEFRVHRRDHTSFIARVTNTPIHDQSGQLVGIVGVSLDITERYQTEEALKLANTALGLTVEEQTQNLVDAIAQLQSEIIYRNQAEAQLKTQEIFLRQVIDVAPDSIFVKDEAGRILMANQAASTMHGTSIDRMLGQYEHDFNPNFSVTDTQAFLATNHQVMRTRQPQKILDQRILKQTGEVHWYQTIISPFIDAKNQVKGIIGVSTDITELKHIEAELRAAKEAAEAASHAKSLFLASMSHELRTPLNAILGFAQILLQTFSNDSADQSYLQAIIRNGDHLLHLINSVLDLAKIETGDMSLQTESCELPSFLAAVVSKLGIRAGYKGLQLKLETDPDLPSYIRTDTQKLRQVLHNLLGNAVKFTQAGQIVLRVSTHPPASDPFYTTDRPASHAAAISRWEPHTNTPLLYFEIEDTGQGIADSQLGSIFEAFTQGNNLINYTEGTGLGLTISRNHIRLMGGGMGATSVLNQGSCFWFTIPLMLDEVKVTSLGQSSHQVIGLVPNQPSYRILLIEDQPERGDDLKQRMSAIGLHAYDVTYGQAAISFWESWHPHLILMDLALSSWSHDTLVSQIRSQCQANPDSLVPIIIALIPTDQDRDSRHSLPKGCDDWLSKPIQDHQLFEKIRQYLKVRYIYSDAPLQATSSPSHQKLTPTADQLKTMPLEWIQALGEAAYRCDDNHIFELIKAIPSSHPHLVETLNYLTSNLLFEQIIQLTEPLYKA